MLTSYSDDDAVVSSILAGASGYLLKNTSRAELLRAIRAVAAGHHVSHVLDKLGLSRRSEAAVYAVRKRLVALDDDAG